MNRTKIEILVLDAHGVVLNNPLRQFLTEFAEMTGQDATTVQVRWDEEVRARAWTGELSDAEIWRALSGNRHSIRNDWNELLESHYEAGPAKPYLESWHRRAKLWILSNHRSHWLVPRLHRFRIANYFERVLISDELGAAKPDPKVFDPILRQVDTPGSVVFVDDQSRNVEAARELGIVGIDLNRTTNWAEQVEAALDKTDGAC